jgi:hypothetical protein
MGAPLPQSVMKQQPQQGAPLDRSNRFAANALAVVSSGADINYATGKMLTRAGSGFSKQFLRGGLAWKFRQNFYVETESLPAIGTATFVDFWVGYANSLQGNAGNGNTYPAMLVGSSIANQTGICMTIGSNYSAVNSNSPSNWGAVSSWGAQTPLVAAAENIPLGELTVLVVVRRQTGIELWRNGVMKIFSGVTPTSLPAQTLIIGSFVESTTWCSANDTILAGRSKFEPTAAEIKAFSANPWQLFKNPSNLPLMAALMQSGGIPRKALYFDNANDLIRQSSGGLNVNPLVLVNGVLRPRSSNETPVVLVNGQLRLLAPGETLVL